MAKETEAKRPLDNIVKVDGIGRNSLVVLASRLKEGPSRETLLKCLELLLDQTSHIA